MSCPSSYTAGPYATWHCELRPLLRVRNKFFRSYVRNLYALPVLNICRISSSSYLEWQPFMCHSLPYKSLPSLDYLTTGLLWGGAVNPTPNPQSGELGLRICDRVTQLYPQELGTQLNLLLRQAWSTLGIMFRVVFWDDRPCGLVVSVADYKHRGLGFDSRALLRIFLRELGLKRGPLSLVIG
jgi:hypothetical protein